MPSFDVVSELEIHEVSNAVDQANREITNRFDFKGSDAKYSFEDEKITLTAPNDFQVKQMFDILQTKLSKRQIDIKAIKAGEIQTNLSQAKQILDLQQGISKEDAKKIVKLMKESKLKVQTSIQGDQVRVTGKNRDDLQAAIAFLKESNIQIPMQYDNFRD